MPSDERRLAADARRVVSRDGGEREATKVIRQALRANYDRGKAAGREELSAELGNRDTRTAFLESDAETLDLHGARISNIPNSTRAATAYREAAAILRDAAKAPGPEVRPRDEDDAEEAEEEKAAPKKSTASAKKGSAKKSGAKATRKRSS